MSQPDTNSKENIISIFSENFENNIFSKFTLSSVISKNIEFKNVFIRPVILKDGRKLSFLYRYPTKDVTRNHSLEEAITLLEQYLGTTFLQADLFTVDTSYHFLANRKGNSRLTEKKITGERSVTADHNKTKQRLVGRDDQAYLKVLGIMTDDGKVRNDRQDKFRQINKYIEFFSQALKESGLQGEVKVADMGSGKGYLTFAMYDYLRSAGFSPSVTGIEFRQDMVALCNHMADSVGFSNLHFRQGTIETAEIPEFNVLVALHACDTATDEALFRGISSGADIILVSPCCHKQLRKQFHPDTDLKALGKFGILEERQAEILTDTIRALLLEASGYKTKVFEFISTEHTPKNLMIAAVKKTGHVSPDPEKLKEINLLKERFGIREHHLETLLLKIQS